MRAVTNAAVRFLLPLALLAPAHPAFAADPGAVPPEVGESVRARFPGAKILVSTSCALGVRGARAYGLLVQGSDASGDDPLRAAVAVADGPGWKITELERRVEGTHAAGDILGVYWDRKQGFKGRFEIRCTSPKGDPDIGAEMNGEFLGPFAAKLRREVRHLCFTADDIYNSWACWTLNPGTGLVELSFVQFNAD